MKKVVFYITCIVGILIMITGCKKNVFESDYVNKGYLVFTGNGSVSQVTPALPDTLPGNSQFYGVYDVNSKIFNYRLNWDTLSSLVTTANFYISAEPGEISLTSRNMFTTTSLTRKATSDSATGAIWSLSRLTDTELEEMKNGRWYYTILTVNNPGGEVRGQIKYDHSF